LAQWFSAFAATSAAALLFLSFFYIPKENHHLGLLETARMDLKQARDLTGVPPEESADFLSISLCPHG